MNKKEKIYLPENIRFLRKKHDMTMEELGKKLNKSLSTVGKWETGDSKPPLEIIVELMFIFDVSLDNLMYVDLSNYAGDYSKSAFTDIMVNQSNEEKFLIESYRKLSDDHKKTINELLKLYTTRR